MTHRNKNLPVEISETDQIRSLHLETDSIQSAMSIADPIHMTLRYTQAMVLSLLFKRHPDEITILGVGAGSLTKFFYYYCPKTKIITIEINPKVINVALMMFEVPIETRRHQIIESDAIRYLEKLKCPTALLITDIFDGYGIPKEFTSVKYFQLCFMSIKADGFAIFNFWGSDAKTPNYILNLRKIFFHVLVIESDDPGNIIVMAFKQGYKFPSIKNIEIKLNRLQDKINFDLNYFYKRMLKKNKQSFERIYSD
jgi:spermidine synthase